MDAMTYQRLERRTARPNQGRASATRDAQLRVHLTKVPTHSRNQAGGAVNRTRSSSFFISLYLQLTKLKAPKAPVAHLEVTQQARKQHI